MALDQQELNENQVIEEFGRQLLVPGISEAGQNNLLKKNILLIGLGALGTIASVSYTHLTLPTIYSV